MSILKEIQGFAVLTFPADPLPLAQARAANPYAGTWASGGNLHTARPALAGAGIHTGT